MSTTTQIQYVSDEDGQPVSVLVPIALWKEIASERETAYLLKSETMKKRVLDAMNEEQAPVHASGGTVPIWSPYDSIEGAAALLKVLDEGSPA